MYGVPEMNPGVKNKSRVFDHVNNDFNRVYDRHKENYVKIDGSYSPVVNAHANIPHKSDKFKVK
jgi:hypothetical protein